MSAPRAPLRLGLIGAGRWGQNYIRTIGYLDGVRLACLAIRDVESVRLVEPDCQISANWRDMIAGGEMDGLIIATPAPLHAEMTLAAIEAGLPVLVEKPMTLSVADAQAVAQRAKALGAIVRVDHVHLYSAAWQALKREARGLGPVHAIAAEAGGPGPVRPGTPMLWDWAPHDIAMCLDLLGRTPDTVTGSAITVHDKGCSDTGPGLDLEGTSVDAVLDFAGVTATIRLCNAVSEKRRRFAVTFEKGALAYDDTKTDKLCRGASVERATDPVPLDAGRPLARTVTAFAGAISDGNADVADAELGLDVVRTIERIETAIT